MNEFLDAQFIFPMKPLLYGKQNMPKITNPPVCSKISNPPVIRKAEYIRFQEEIRFEEEIRFQNTDGKLFSSRLGGGLIHGFKQYFFHHQQLFFSSSAELFMSQTQLFFMSQKNNPLICQ